MVHNLPFLFLVSSAFIRVLALGLFLTPMASAADGEMKLTQGAIERTAGGRTAGTEGATYELAGGVRVILAAGTQATIAPKSQLLALWPGRRVPTHSVFLRSGRVDVQIPETAVGKSAVVVAAPDETRVLLKSGRSSIRVAGRRIFAACESGLVSVSEGARFRDVPPGKVRELPRMPAVDRDLVAAPQIRGPAMWVTARSSIPIKGYAWAVVPGAEAYETEIRNIETGQRLARLTTSQTELPALRDGLPPGRYELSVRARDKDSMPGKAGPALPIRVVGIELPKGATVQTEDRIELDLGQSIRFLYADGVTLSGVRGVKAPKSSESIAISEDRLTTLVLRESTQSPPHLLWLVPRKPSVYAHVGPKDAIWPVDTVTVEIRRNANASAELKSSSPPPARVLSGVNPLEVKWHRRDDVWQARVPPQAGPGPWVIRLEVYNHYGAVVGRDFVEVVPLKSGAMLSRAARGRRLLNDRLTTTSLQ